MDVKIRTAVSDEDLEIVRKIALQTWPDAFSSILSPNQINYMLEWMYSIESLKNQTQTQNNVFLLACLDEFSGFASYELNYKNSESAKLHKVYILPEAQGKGVGAALIKEICKIAKGKNQKSVLLNVNRQNKAVKVYEHLGFRIKEEENIDIGNGFFMNDYVMEFRF